MSAGGGEDVVEGASEGKGAPCSYCGIDGAMYLCAGCRSAKYCGDKCQKKEWRKGHKTACPKDHSLAEPPTKEHAPAQPSDGAPGKPDEEDAHAGGPAEHDPAQPGAPPEYDPTPQDARGAPVQLDEADSPAQKSSQPHVPLSNDEPLYEGTYAQCMQARTYYKRNGGYQEDLKSAKLLIIDGAKAWDKGQCDDAMGILLRALEMSMELGEVDLMVHCYSQMGSALVRQDKLDLALQTFREALRLHRAMGKDSHYTVVPHLNHISAVHMRRGEYPEALESCNEALRIMRGTHNADEHPEMEKVLHTLRTLYTKQGKHSEALDTLHELLRIREQKLGKGHPEIAGVFLNIGCIYEEQGKYFEAHANLTEALRLAKKKRGKQHQDVGRIVKCLGVVAMRSGDDGKALQLFEEALEAWAHGNVDTAESLSEKAGTHFNAGVAHQQKKSYKMAKDHFGAAVNIYTRLHGPRHSQTKHAMDLALLCAKLS